jgi:hypothetical protein
MKAKDRELVEIEFRGKKIKVYKGEAEMLKNLGQKERKEVVKTKERKAKAQTKEPDKGTIEDPDKKPLSKERNLKKEQQ